MTEQWPTEEKMAEFAAWVEKHIAPLRTKVYDEPPSLLGEPAPTSERPPCDGPHVHWAIGRDDPGPSNN